MNDLASRIAKLTPEQRELFEKRLKKEHLPAPAELTSQWATAYNAIPVAPSREYYPLSAAQKRLYILNQLEGENTAYHISGAFRLDGVLDYRRVEKVFEQLIQRHEGFRTSFAAINGEPVQRIHPGAALAIERKEVGEDILAEAVRNFIRPFDLGRAPLLRVGLFHIDSGYHVLVYDLHHIIADGTSMTILTEEFMNLYAGKQLPPPSIQYKDFAVWQNDRFQSERLKGQAEYWLKAFSGELSRLQLPTDYSRVGLESIEGASRQLELDSQLSLELKHLAADHGATLFMTLLAAVNVLFARCTGQDDIIIGTPVAGRRHVELERVIGIFLNTIVLRNQPRSDRSFGDFLSEVTENALQAFQNQDYQFEMLLEKLDVPRDRNRPPLFDVMFNMLNMGITDKTFDESELRATPLGMELQRTKFDLEFYIYEIEQQIKIRCVYRTALFKSDTIEYLLDEYLRLLQLVAVNPDLPLHSYDVFSPHRVHFPFRTLRPANPHQVFKKEAIEQSIVSRFEECVERYPERLAVKTRANSATYSQLNRKANRLTHQVTEHSTPTVALLFEHDLDMVTGILGALKAGKVYVPMDPSYPVERLAYMLRDTKTSLILTNEHNLTVADQLRRITGVDIIDLSQTDETRSGENLNLSIEPSQPAYILYTSGSTGQPKGVFQNHRNVLHFIRNYTNNLHINFDDRLTLFSTYCFDAAIMDIYGALLNGATLYPFNIKGGGGPDELSCWLREEGITIFHSTPTVYRYLVDNLRDGDRFPAIRLVVMGGEAVFKKDVDAYKRYFDDHCLFVNGLGPTESTVTLQNFIGKNSEITGNAVPVGYPVEDTTVYILDGAGEETGIYRIGEIVYRSEYLALGYWNLPDRTREVFGPDPLTGEGRVYRSGDLGRRLPDGSIEFFGRKDFQVKIMGYRIELAEVEAKLSEIESVREVVVVADEDERGNHYLCAYLTSNQVLDPAELRKELQKSLPFQMIPAHFIQIARMPLTPNGKLNRKELPRPEEQLVLTSGNIAPASVLERAIARVWAEVLRIPFEKVGIDANFFSLGGNSLSMIRVEAELWKREIHINYSDLYQHPTIRSLISLIEGGVNEAKSRAEKTITGPPESDNRASQPLPGRNAVVLPDIEPFNDFRYKSCFYSSLFPILPHFGVDIAGVLANDLIVYTSNPDAAEIRLGIDFVPVKPVQAMLDEIGIGFRAKLRSDHIIGDISGALSAGHPVIIWIDCFFESLRIDTHQQIHWPHTLLIYGFDPETRQFRVIEHRHRDSLSYEKQVIDYQDLCDAYRGYMDHFQPESAFLTFYEFFRTGAGPASGLLASDLLVANLRDNRAVLLNGLNSLEKFKREFTQALASSDFRPELERLIPVLNNISNAKLIEKYRLERLFAGLESVLGLIEGIIADWGQIRLKIARAFYMGGANPEHLKPVLPLIDKIRKAESDLLAEVLDSQPKPNMGSGA